MIEFVSLLLGLVVGAHPVEVSLTGDASLELRLNNRIVGEADQPPWRFEVDFGRDLEPHELVAIARDTEGREIGRARQWVNLQLQAGADATMIFSGGEPSSPRQVGLEWVSIGERQPKSIEVLFDGTPLSFDDPARIPLPDYDPDNIHLVSATLSFHDETHSRLEATFGAGLGSTVKSELTALAIEIDGKRKQTPKPEALQGWFLKDGEPLTVHGVENGYAEIIVVRDPAVQEALEDTLRSLSLYNMRKSDRRRAYGNLGFKTYLRIMSPAAAPLSPTEVTPEMFMRSEALEASERGLLWMSQRTRPQSFPLLLPNAVALAGSQAHASTRRRAVLLMLGDTPSLERDFDAASTRRYLEHLRVPLHVWSLGSQPRPEWGEVHELPLAGDNFSRGHRRFKQLVETLREDLDRQRIVWLEGSHLPQSIELAPEAIGIRLAGR